MSFQRKTVLLSKIIDLKELRLHLANQATSQAYSDYTDKSLIILHLQVIKVNIV